MGDKWFYLLVKKDDIFNNTLQGIKTNYAEGHIIFGIYVELMLASVDEQGVIKLDPFFLKETRPENLIADMINEKPENVLRAFKLLSQHGLIQIVNCLDEGMEAIDVVVPTAVHNCKSKSEAHRKRIARENQKALEEQKALEGERAKPYGTYRNIFLLDDEVEYLISNYGEKNALATINTASFMKKENGWIPEEYIDDFEYCLAEADKL